MTLLFPIDGPASGAPLCSVRALVEDLLAVVPDGKPRVPSSQLSRDLMHASTIVTHLFRSPSTDTLDVDTVAVVATRVATPESIARRTVARCACVRAFQSAPALAYLALLDALTTHLAECCGAAVRTALERFDCEGDSGVVALTAAVQRFDRIAHALCLTVFRAVDKERECHRTLESGHDSSCLCITGTNVPPELLRGNCNDKFVEAFRRVLFDEAPQKEAVRVRRWFARVLHDTWEAVGAVNSANHRGANWAPFRALIGDVFCSCGRGSTALEWFCEAWAKGLLRSRCDAVLSGSGELSTAPHVAGATVIQHWRCVAAVLTQLCGLPGTWREASARAATDVVQPWLHTVLPLIVLVRSNDSTEEGASASFSGAQLEVLAAAVRLEQLKPSLAAGDADFSRGLGACASPWLEQLLRKALVASLRRLVRRCFDGLDDVAAGSATWPQKIYSGVAAGTTGTLVLGRFLGELADWLKQHAAALEGIVAAPGSTDSRRTAVVSWARALIAAAGSGVFKLAAVLLADALHVGAMPSSVVPCDGRVMVLEFAVEWVAERDLLLRRLSDGLQQRLLRIAPAPDDVLDAEWALVSALKRSAAVGGSSDGTVLLRGMERMMQDMQGQRDALDVGQLQQLLGDALPPGSKVESRHGCVEVQPVILRATVWPLVSDIAWIRTLPLELKVASRLAEDMYRRRWPQRRLSWSHLNSRCDVEVVYSNGGRRANRVTVTLPLIGASILSYFDLRCTDSIELREVGEVVVDDSTRVIDAETCLGGGDEERRAPLKAAVQQMRGMVQSLVGLRILVEKRSPASHSPPEAPSSSQQEVSTLHINRSFSCARRRIHATVSGGAWSSQSTDRRAAPPSRSPLQGVPASDDEKVAASRLVALKAAIVRVMKARREATHSDLFEAVKQQLAPLYDLRMDKFKDMLSSLMEADYLARAENRDGYVYVS